MTDHEYVEIVQRLSHLEADAEQGKAEREAMLTKLDSMIERFTKYEARWGGIVMILSAIIGLMLAFKTELKEYFLGR